MATSIPFTTDTTGAVERIRLDPANPTGAYVASVNGGIFKTGDYTTVLQPTPTRPSWVTTSDQLPSLSMGDLAVDPLNSQRVVAGAGCMTSGAPCGHEGLVYVSCNSQGALCNGGTSWNVTSDPLFTVFDPGLGRTVGRKIHAVTVRGPLILVATGQVLFPNGARTGGIFRRQGDTQPFESRAGQGGLPAVLGQVFDLIADPLNPLAYYAVIGNDGAATGGVYRTADEGTTWTRVSDNDTAPRGLNFVLNQAATRVTNARFATAPTGELYVIVALDGQAQHIGFTTNQGTTWGSMDLPSVPTGGPSANGPQAITSISRAAAPATAIVLNSGAAHGLRAGQHVRLAGVPSFGTQDLNGDWIVGPVGSTTEFTLRDRITGAESSATTGVTSVTGGTWQGWDGANQGGQGNIHLALAVDPTRPERIYLGGDASAIFVARGDRTLPAGLMPSSQWAPLHGANTAHFTAPHADVRDLVVDGAGNLLAATDGGPYVRTDPDTNTGDWTSLAGNMVTAEMLTVAIDPLSNAILGGLQDNGSPASDGPMTGAPQQWTQIETADGRGVAAVDAQTTVGGLSVSYRYTTWQGEDDFRRHVFDSTGTVVPPPAPPPPAPALPYVKIDLQVAGTSQLLRDVDAIDWMETLVVNHFAPDRLLIGGRTQGIWESMDRGDTVTLVAGSPVGATGIAAGVASNVEAMWAVNHGTTTTPGVVARRVAAGAMTPVTFPGAFPYAVTMDPADPLIAYVATCQPENPLTPGQVFRTFDGGVQWEPVTGDLAQTDDGHHTGVGCLRDMVYIAGGASGDRVVVAATGGTVGAYMMAVDNPGVWTRVGTNLPRAPVAALDYDPGTDTLVVGTTGRGAWSVSGVTALNRAPNALCQDYLEPANHSCMGSALPSNFDGGSTDPEGDALSFERVNPATLEPIGLEIAGLVPVDVTILVTDSNGSSALCPVVQYQLLDQTPPTLTAPPNVNVSSCLGSETITVGQATATDNCATALVPTGQVISKNGVTLSPPIPVVGGQVTLGPGSYVIQWTVSDGFNPVVTTTQTVNVGAAIVASNSYWVRDRASVVDLNDDPAAVLNSGSGITSIGGDGATVGQIVAGGAVTVAWNGYVYGNITAVGSVTVNDPTKHFGSIVPVTSVALPAPPALPTFPAPTLGDRWINPGQTLPLSPGSYAQIGVNGNPNPLTPAVLILSAGDYFFTNMYFNAAGLVVVAQPGTRIFVSGNVTYNTPIVTAVGSNELAPVVLGVSGTGSLALYAPFTGQVVAPQRNLVVGTANGMIFTGSFYARSIDVTPDSVLVCDPSAASQEPPACSDGALSSGETDVDCGGAQCPDCLDGDSCVAGGDCVSKVCTGSVCQVPTCTDNQHNGTETAKDCGGSCPACPVTCNSFTYQAESMFHSTGNAWWQGGWNIYSNGYISTNHNFSAGSNVITVSAFGQQAQNVLPHMRVTVNGVAANPSAGVNVTTSGFNPYTFTFNAGSAGSREIRVVYDNDASGWFGDRNLIVRTVAVSCP